MRRCRALPWLPALLGFLALPVGADPLPTECRDRPVPPPHEAVAFAIDGDTVATQEPRRRIRLWGVQAPELRDKATGRETAEGMRARAALEELLSATGWRVRVTAHKWDRYCRPVALVEGVADPPRDPPRDLALALIEAGWVHGYYLDDGVPGRTDLSIVYAAAERRARQERRGLWPAWLGER